MSFLCYAMTDDIMAETSMATDKGTNKDMTKDMTAKNLTANRYYA